MIRVPREIEIKVINVIGVFEKKFSWNRVSGLDLNENLFDIKDIRKVYEAVIPIDRIIKNVIIKLNFEEIIVSIIMSLEKNPEVNGIAINIIPDKPKIDKTKGSYLFLCLLFVYLGRRSCGL